MVQYISTVETFNKIRSQAEAEGKPVIIDYTAAWCGPCKMIAPILEKLSEEYAGKILVYKVDVDGEEPADARVPEDAGKSSQGAKLSEGAGIKAMPTFHAYLPGASLDSASPSSGSSEELRGANPAALTALFAKLSA